MSKNSFISVGIDALHFYTSPFYLDLATLAQAHKLPADKYYQTTGQHKMSVAAPDEDLVTLAANAAAPLIAEHGCEQIAMLLLATESNYDQAKAAATYVHQLLGLSNYCRTVELKQACYAASAGLQLALPYLQQNPDKKVLLIASDIASYELNSAAESSKGCGAVAMLLSAAPKILAIEPESGVYTENAMDFWRPNYLPVAIVNGKLSCNMYLKLLQETWKDYHNKTGRNFQEIDYFCYHTPIPRLAKNAHKRLARFAAKKILSKDELDTQINDSLRYSRAVGNCYTASLFLSLTSLLDHNSALANKRIGFYSYGSGSTAEFYTGIVQPNYQLALQTLPHNRILQRRCELNYTGYLKFYHFNYPTDGSNVTIPQYSTGQFHLSAIEKHKRIYTANDDIIKFEEKIDQVA